MWEMILTNFRETEELPGNRTIEIESTVRWKPKHRSGCTVRHNLWFIKLTVW